MRKNINKTDDPKNDDIKYLRKGDVINIHLDLGIYNHTYKRIKYSEKDLNDFIYNIVNSYFTTLGKIQNKKPFDFYDPL